MVGTNIGGGGCGGDEDAPPQPQQFLSSSSSSVRPSFPTDSEEFSDFLNQFLSPEMDHNNNNIMITTSTTKNRVLHPSSSSSSVFNFSSHHNNHLIHHNNNNNNDDYDDDEDAYIPEPLLPPNSNANTNQQEHSITCSIQKFGEDSELPSKAVPPSRTSSKRSRAAEFHTLSEKRRRNRINEKMKALQNLIPNSNKTDKASMLDEAIEYLRQLQVQVQLLMIRNGLSLHPMSLPGGLRPIVLPHSGLNSDEGNGFKNSINGITSSANHDQSSVPPSSFCFLKQCSISNQSTDMPSSSSFQPPSIKDAHCSNITQLLMDATRIGKTPSPDVS